ncbi:alkaline phosphatase family protein [Gordonia jinghuaiqii]|uniref:Alkaline phosphatase family protein n=1 Tax=Gordonia jinghuaiqii TaxID=2758710 RepID=A0A7D7LP87_9ACTN|nr:alkaline phosphatase D family protein [Gordonia jinghuaiqii]MCR5976728.1 alkaline phosphatase family protein [Gordonia jinghuaiqii]QMS99904.1 alkaline phosphatase family protein [Gordonia jinghuaiqii]
MSLVLGPILRHVDETSALVWVQTAAPAEVEVLGCRAPTFEVLGHNYALVEVTGLSPDTTTEYRVHVDGVEVWPEPDSAFPPSVIRTRGPATANRHRFVFGSCRYPRAEDPKLDEKLGLDALDCYAVRMRHSPVEEWPDTLILLGDQVYADELTPQVKELLASSRASAAGPSDEVVSFDEYEGLYRHTWGDPEIRWILSTVATAMIFDDHDIRDDWNTSDTWRRQMRDEPWWRDRIRAGLASYWVYQHLGNLSPTELADSEDYRRVLDIDGDCWSHLVELADRADHETDSTKGVRFSFRWDLGGTRLIMIDSRNGRILDSGTRKMLSDVEFDWLQRQVDDDIESVDHLVLGSSLPWLLPPVISDVETLNEIGARRPGRRGQLSEKVRQGADLEHWPAFFDSFVRLTGLVRGVADRTPGPATVSVLSGDVHHSYAARADFPERPAAAVYQLVCSPVHNAIPPYIKVVFSLGWSKRLAAVVRRWARRRGSPTLPVSWHNALGPLFGNTIATLALDGRDARVTFEQPDLDGTLGVAGLLPLTGESAAESVANERV